MDIASIGVREISRSSCIDKPPFFDETTGVYGIGEYQWYLRNPLRNAMELRIILALTFVFVAAALTGGAVASEDVPFFTDRDLERYQDQRALPPDYRKSDPDETKEGLGAGGEGDLEIEVLDYGRFSAKRLGKVRADNITIGELSVHDIESLELLERTDRINAGVGVAFGLRYVVKGKDRDHRVPLTIRVLTPGLRRPDSGKVSHREEWSSLKEVGAVTYDGFIFEEDWEVVEGKWTIQILHDNDKLAERDFAIYAARTDLPSDLPIALRAEIERLASSACRDRLNAVKKLDSMGRKAVPAIPHLIKVLTFFSMPSQIDFDCGSGKAASKLLSKLGGPAVQPLVAVLGHKDWKISAGASESLVNMGPEAVDPLLAELRDNTDWNIRRAVADVLGKIKNSRAVEPLIGSLGRDEEPAVRGRAAEALAEIKDDRAIAPLKTAAESDENWHVRADALSSLAKLTENDAIPTLIGALDNDPSGEVREAAQEALSALQDMRTVGPSLRSLRDEDPALRRSAAIALGKSRSGDAVEPLIVALQDKDWDVRRSAAQSLGLLQDERAVPGLMNALRDTDRNVRVAAAWALGSLKSREAAGPLLGMVKDRDVDIRSTSIRALGKIGEKKALAAIVEALDDESSYVREASVEALGDMGGSESVSALIKALRITERKKEVGYEAVKSLIKIGRPATGPLIAAAKGTTSHGVRLRIAEALEGIGEPAVEPLRKALESRDRYTREVAEDALNRIEKNKALRGR